MKKFLNLIMLSLLIISLTGCSFKNKSNNEISYYCNEGTLKGNNCAIAVAEPVSLACPNGYNLVNGMCLKEELIAATATKVCEEGYKLSKDQKCLSETTYEMVKTSSCELPSNVVKGQIKVLENSSIITGENKAYIKNGLCYMTIWQDYNESLRAYYNQITTNIDFTIEEFCPEGTIEVKKKCYKTSAPKDGYTCPNGELKDQKCITYDIKNPINSCQGERFIYNTTTNQCERINLTKAQEK